MRRKFTWSILGAACLALSLNAAPRSAGEALKVARSFYAGKSLLRSVSDADFRLVYTGEGGDLRSASSSPYYYIYNVGEADGFVMVSGDDRVAPVIGYSLEGSFRPDDLPSNVKGWFADYERQIDHARTLPERTGAGESSGLRSDDGLPERVEPMVTTKWSQEAPYYDLCPLDGDQRSLAGCVATAAAQIMNYHQWPEKATGEGYYQMDGKEETHPVDLSVYTFDWENMSDTYDSTSTAAQNHAVAELMYAAGAAGWMIYSANGSSTMDEYMTKGLIENFNYDKNLVCLRRDHYASEEWRSSLRRELAEKRPVLYGGSSFFGGHAFVCDGYDEEGLFHINWGWGGMADGYFELDLLDSFNGNFSYMQDMIVGIQKPTEESAPYHALFVRGMEVPASLSQGDTLVLACGFFLDGCSALELETAWGIYEDDELRSTLAVHTNLYDPHAVNLVIQRDTIASFRLEPGFYTLEALYRTPGEEEWTVAGMANNNNPPNLMRVDESLIEFGYARDLSGVQPVHADSALVTGKPAVLRAVVRNESEEEYNPLIRFVAIPSLYPDSVIELYNEGIYLLPSEEKEVQAQIELPLTPGEYMLFIYANDFIDGTESVVTVAENPTGIEPVPTGDDLRVWNADGYLVVSSTSALQEACLYDVTGKLASTSAAGDMRIRIATAGLPDGVYVLRIRTGQTWVNKKVWIQ